MARIGWFGLASAMNNGRLAGTSSSASLPEQAQTKPAGPRARLLLAALLASPAAADVVEQGPADAAPSGLLAGVARADITPPVGIAQMNWGSQTHIEAEANDPVGMSVRALVLSDGRQRFAMVDIDRLNVDGLEPAIEAASRRTGIPAEHIRLAASHTHAGPMVSPAKGPPGVDLSPYLALAERYRLRVVDAIVGAVIEAAARARPAHIHGGRGEGTININRRIRILGDRPPAVGRNPAGFVDRELVVFRIDDGEGRPLAVLANFPCHGTVLAYENKTVSPDWPGMTRKVVEAALPGALCLFFQGAAGNQGPVEGFTGDLGVAHRLGRILGHQIAAVAAQIETVRREPAWEGFVESTAYQAKQPWRVAGPRDATLRFASKLVSVPRRAYTERDLRGMRIRLEAARAQLAELGPEGDPWQRHQAGARARRFAELLERWQAPAPRAPLQIEVQALRIGGLALVAMPGEPFAEIGAAVRERSPFEFTMFCGYSDGLGGDYLPTAEEYEEQGYEVERTPYGPAAAELVVEAAGQLLEDLR